MVAYRNGLIFSPVDTWLWGRDAEWNLAVSGCRISTSEAAMEAGVAEREKKKRKKKSMNFLLLLSFFNESFERETVRQTESDRQIWRQKQGDRHRNRDAERDRDRETETESERQRQRRADRQIDRDN